jgi:hypothetical protein
MGKYFIDPKRSEILSIFKVFPCTTQIALFWPKLLPALFLKKPGYPCPFEILAEALSMRCSLTRYTSHKNLVNLTTLLVFKWQKSDKIGQIAKIKKLWAYCPKVSSHQVSLK